MANVATAQLNAWNVRAKQKIPLCTPISKNIELRTEFAGAGTAEVAVAATVQIWNGDATAKDKISVDVSSIGDWAQSAQTLASLNHPRACRFRDILGLAGKDLRSKLQEELTEEALSNFPNHAKACTCE